MKSLDEVISTIIDLRDRKRAYITLLAVCPNSAAVTEAAIKVAAENRMPMLFAATLNQVDRDGGYTGWTPTRFVEQLHSFAGKYDWDGPLYPCLDHGGPWLKDKHTQAGLSFEGTMGEVKESITACLEAGYRLLHIDATVDRMSYLEAPVPIEKVVERTIELMKHAELERRRLGLADLSYEVGTEEVQGGLVDFDNFSNFIKGLRKGLAASGLTEIWPCFVVGKVGTDLHTTYFDRQAARRLYDVVSPFGSLVKGHYTDWVANPEDYPVTGMGGANVGPEFTSAECRALESLTHRETELCRADSDIESANFMGALQEAVIDSGRWRKWLRTGEEGKDFMSLTAERRDWLARTCARYVWAQPVVEAARAELYDNLSLVMPDPRAYVVDRIAREMEKYVVAFNLCDSLTLLECY